jgi:hypothetical protein
MPQSGYSNVPNNGCLFSMKDFKKEYATDETEV